MIGICHVCGTFGRLYLDHNHKTGIIRGKTCNRCNVKLVSFENRKHAKHFRYLYRQLSGRFRFRWNELHASSFYSLNGYPPAILCLDDIEIVAVSCSLFHNYLANPPLANLNLQYREHMEIDV